MKMAPFAFGTTDWSRIEPTEHKGEIGMAAWRPGAHATSAPSRTASGCAWSSTRPATWPIIRCNKGHILFCMEGELETTLEDGRKFVLTAGMSYQVGDNAEAHQSYTRTGARLFIVD